MDGISIIQALPEHLDAIERIEKSSFSAPWPREVLRSQLTGEGKLCFAAVLGGILIGYISLAVILDVAHITNIAVSPGHRRLGAGGALLKASIDMARLMELNYMMLEARISNIQAISLYSRFGFQTVGKRPGYYLDPREDAVLMTLFLEGDDKDAYSLD